MFVLKLDREDVLAIADRFDPGGQDRDEEQRLLTEVMPMVREQGYATVDQLREVARWKSPRAVGHVARNTPRLVEVMTGIALSEDDLEVQMAALCAIRGVQIPTASAFLYFAYPDHYPIADVRAFATLGVALDGRAIKMEEWLAYVPFCRNKAAALGVPIRTLDKALWQSERELAGW